MNKHHCIHLIAKFSDAKDVRVDFPKVTQIVN